MPDPGDDLRHKLAPSPHARESMFHTVPLAHGRLVVCTYTWVGADDRASYLFVVAGEGDERHAAGELHGVDVGAADFDDWQVGALSLRHTKPLMTAELAVELDGVSFRATYDAMHPAISYRTNRDGCPAYNADDRFEQSCWVQGTLSLHGREITIDTTGQRDHSWGTRDWATFQDWKWISAQAGPALAVNLMLAHARGETTRHGYVFRDGEVTPIIDARVVARYDADFRQTGADVEIIDESGRTTRMTIERFAFFSFEAAERTLLNEAGCTGTVDGAEAVVHFECGWDSGYAATQASRAAAALG
jgi:hypothetical protein